MNDWKLMDGVYKYTGNIIDEAKTYGGGDEYCKLDNYGLNKLKKGDILVKINSREYAEIYELKNDLLVALGQANKKTHLEDGGLTQSYIPNLRELIDSQVLLKIEEVSLGEYDSLELKTIQQLLEKELKHDLYEKSRLIEIRTKELSEELIEEKIEIVEEADMLIEDIGEEFLNSKDDLEAIIANERSLEEDKKMEEFNISDVNKIHTPSVKVQIYQIRENPKYFFIGKRDGDKVERIGEITGIKEVKNEIKAFQKEDSKGLEQNTTVRRGQSLAVY